MKLKKLVAVLTGACFLYSSVFAAVLQAAVGKTHTVKEFKRLLDQSVIPQSAGRVADYSPGSGETVVVNVQDLHCHPEAQRNIARIIGAIDKKYPLKKIYIEGASGDVDTQWLANIKDDKYRRQITETLLDQGKLTGAEYYSVTAQKPDILAGIEDEKVYKENFVRLNRIINNKEIYKKALVELRGELELIKERHYNPQNARFEKFLIEYRAGKIEPKKYYKLLKKYVEKLNTSAYRYNNISYVDINRFKNLALYLELMNMGDKLNYGRISRELQGFMGVLKARLPFEAYNSLVEKTDNFSRLDELYGHLSRISKEYDIKVGTNYPELAAFFQYQEKSKNLNPLVLVDEEKKLVGEIHSGLSNDISEFEVSFLSSFFEYFDSYLNNSLSANDYDYFNANFARFRSLWPKYSANDRIERLATDFRMLDDYYAANVKRNTSFLENIPALRRNAVQAAGGRAGETGKNASGPEELAAEKFSGALGQAKDIIVLVTGGFHTEGLGELLQRGKVSYFVITPNVTRETASADLVYSGLVKYQAKIFTQSFALWALSKYSPQERLKSIVSSEVLKALNPSDPNISLKDYAQEQLKDLARNSSAGTAAGKNLTEACSNFSSYSGMGKVKFLSCEQQAGGNYQLSFEVSDNEGAGKSDLKLVFDAEKGAFALDGVRAEAAAETPAAGQRLVLPENIKTAQALRAGLTKGITNPFVNFVYNRIVVELLVGVNIGARELTRTLNPVKFYRSHVKADEAWKNRARAGGIAAIWAGMVFSGYFAFGLFNSLPLGIMASLVAAMAGNIVVHGVYNTVFRDAQLVSDMDSIKEILKEAGIESTEELQRYAAQEKAAWGEIQQAYRNGEISKEELRALGKMKRRQYGNIKGVGTDIYAYIHLSVAALFGVGVEIFKGLMGITASNTAVSEAGFTQAGLVLTAGLISTWIISTITGKDRVLNASDTVSEKAVAENKLLEAIAELNPSMRISADVDVEDLKQGVELLSKNFGGTSAAFPRLRNIERVRNSEYDGALSSSKKQIEGDIDRLKNALKNMKIDPKKTAIVWVGGGMKQHHLVAGEDTAINSVHVEISRNVLRNSRELVSEFIIQEIKAQIPADADIQEVVFVDTTQSGESIRMMQDVLDEKGVQIQGKDIKPRQMVLLEKHVNNDLQDKFKFRLYSPKDYEGYKTGYNGYASGDSIPVLYFNARSTGEDKQTFEQDGLEFRVSATSKPRQYLNPNGMDIWEAPKVVDLKPVIENRGSVRQRDRDPGSIAPAVKWSGYRQGVPTERIVPIYGYGSAGKEASIENDLAGIVAAYPGFAGLTFIEKANVLEKELAKGYGLTQQQLQELLKDNLGFPDMSVPEQKQLLTERYAVSKEFSLEVINALNNVSKYLINSAYHQMLLTELDKKGIINGKSSSAAEGGSKDSRELEQYKANAASELNRLAEVRGDIRSGNPVSILMACRANRERSYLWNMTALNIAQQQGLSNVEVRSAGVKVADKAEIEKKITAGEYMKSMRKQTLPLAELAQYVAEQMLPDVAREAEGFESTPITPEMVADADIVIVADSLVYQEILNKCVAAGMEKAEVEKKLVYFTRLSDSVANYNVSMPDFTTFRSDEVDKLPEEARRGAFRKDSPQTQALLKIYGEMTGQALSEGLFGYPVGRSSEVKNISEAATEARGQDGEKAGLLKRIFNFGRTVEKPQAQPTDVSRLTRLRNAGITEFSAKESQIAALKFSYGDVFGMSDKALNGMNSEKLLDVYMQEAGKNRRFDNEEELLSFRKDRVQYWMDSSDISNMARAYVKYCENEKAANPKYDLKKNAGLIVDGLKKAALSDSKYSTVPESVLILENICGIGSRDAFYALAEIAASDTTGKIPALKGLFENLDITSWKIVSVLGIGENEMYRKTSPLRAAYTEYVLTSDPDNLSKENKIDKLNYFVNEVRLKKSADKTAFLLENYVKNVLKADEALNVKFSSIVRGKAKIIDIYNALKANENELRIDLNEEQYIELMIYVCGLIPEEVPVEDTVAYSFDLITKNGDTKAEEIFPNSGLWLNERAKVYYLAVWFLMNSSNFAIERGLIDKVTYTIHLDKIMSQTRLHEYYGGIANTEYIIGRRVINDIRNKKSTFVSLLAHELGHNMSGYNIRKVTQANDQLARIWEFLADLGSYAFAEVLGEAGFKNEWQAENRELFVEHYIDVFKKDQGTAHVGESRECHEAARAFIESVFQVYDTVREKYGEDTALPSFQELFEHSLKYFADDQPKTGNVFAGLQNFTWDYINRYVLDKNGISLALDEAKVREMRKDEGFFGIFNVAMIWMKDAFGGLGMLDMRSGDAEIINGGAAEGPAHAESLKMGKGEYNTDGKSRKTVNGEKRAIEFSAGQAGLSEVKKLGKELVNAGEAKSITVKAKGREFNVVVDNKFGAPAQTDGYIGALIEKALESKNADIKNLPETIVITYLDESSHLFEDHIANGFIGVNRAFGDITDEKAKDLLLKVNLVHEFTHELTKLTGDKFEAEQLKRDAEFAAALMKSANIPIKGISGIANALYMVRGLDSLEFLEALKKSENARPQGIFSKIGSFFDSSVKTPQDEEKDIRRRYALYKKVSSPENLGRFLQYASKASIAGQDLALKLLINGNRDLFNTIAKNSKDYKSVKGGSLSSMGYIDAIASESLFKQIEAMESILNVVSIVAKDSLKSSNPGEASFGGRLTDYMIALASNRNGNTGSDISGQAVYELQEFIKLENDAVINFMLNGLEQGTKSTKLQPVRDILLAEPASEKALEILRDRPFVNERTGYLIIDKLQADRKSLEAVIKDDKIDIAFRVYAFHYYAALFTGSTDTTELDGMIDLLGGRLGSIDEKNDTAETLLKRLANDDQRVEALFGDNLLQNAEAKVYLMSLLIVLQKHLKLTRPESFSALSGWISRSVLLDYWNNALASKAKYFIFGGRIVSRMKEGERAGNFVMTAAHEMMHGIINEEYGYSSGDTVGNQFVVDFKRGSFHELLADKAAYKVAEVLGLDAEKFNSFLCILDQRSIAEANGFRTEEVHTAARAQDSILSEKLKERNVRNIDIKTFIEVALGAMKDPRLESKTFAETMAYITVYYLDAARPLRSENRLPAVELLAVIADKLSGLAGDMYKILSPAQLTKLVQAYIGNPFLLGGETMREHYRDAREYSGRDGADVRGRSAGWNASARGADGTAGRIPPITLNTAPLAVVLAAAVAFQNPMIAIFGVSALLAVKLVQMIGRSRLFQAFALATVLFINACSNVMTPTDYSEYKQKHRIELAQLRNEGLNSQEKQMTEKFGYDMTDHLIRFNHDARLLILQSLSTEFYHYGSGFWEYLQFFESDDNISPEDAKKLYEAFLGKPYDLKDIINDYYSDNGAGLFAQTYNLDAITSVPTDDAQKTRMFKAIGAAQIPLRAKIAFMRAMKEQNTFVAGASTPEVFERAYSKLVEYDMDIADETEEKIDYEAAFLMTELYANDEMGNRVHDDLVEFIVNRFGGIRDIAFSLYDTHQVIKFKKNVLPLIAYLENSGALEKSSLKDVLNVFSCFNDGIGARESQDSYQVRVDRFIAECEAFGVGQASDITAALNVNSPGYKSTMKLMLNHIGDGIAVRSYMEYMMDKNETARKYALELIGDAKKTLASSSAPSAADLNMMFFALHMYREYVSPDEKADIAKLCYDKIAVIENAELRTKCYFTLVGAVKSSDEETRKGFPVKYPKEAGNLSSMSRSESLPYKEIFDRKTNPNQEFNVRAYIPTAEDLRYPEIYFEVFKNMGLKEVIAGKKFQGTLNGKKVTIYVNSDGTTDNYKGKMYEYINDDNTHMIFVGGHSGTGRLYDKSNEEAGVPEKVNLEKLKRKAFGFFTCSSAMLGGTKVKTMFPTLPCIFTTSPSNNTDPYFDIPVILNGVTSEKPWKDIEKGMDAALKTHRSKTGYTFPNDEWTRFADRYLPSTVGMNMPKYNTAKPDYNLETGAPMAVDNQTEDAVKQAGYYCSYNTALKKYVKDNFISEKYFGRPARDTVNIGGVNIAPIAEFNGNKVAVSVLYRHSSKDMQTMMMLYELNAQISMEKINSDGSFTLFDKMRGLQLVIEYTKYYPRAKGLLPEILARYGYDEATANNITSNLPILYKTLDVYSDGKAIDEKTRIQALNYLFQVLGGEFHQARNVLDANGLLSQVDTREGGVIDQILNRQEAQKRLLDQRSREAIAGLSKLQSAAAKNFKYALGIGLESAVANILGSLGIKGLEKFSAEIALELAGRYPKTRAEVPGYADKAKELSVKTGKTIKTMKGDGPAGSMYISEGVYGYATIDGAGDILVSEGFWEHFSYDQQVLAIQHEFSEQEYLAKNPGKTFEDYHAQLTDEKEKALVVKAEKLVGDELKTQQFTVTESLEKALNEFMPGANIANGAKIALATIESGIVGKNTAGESEKRLLGRSSGKARIESNFEAIHKYINTEKAARKNHRFLNLADISIEDLPAGYSTTNGLRPVEEIPENMPNTLEEAYQRYSADVDLLGSDVFLVSQHANGENKFARLGMLGKERRPVVVLSSLKASYMDELLGDFKAAMIADALGIGPKVHGLFKDEKGSYHLVMDIVPGDFPGINEELITPATINDLEEIYRRIDKARLNIDMEFQYFVTPNSRALLIDHGFLLEKSSDEDSEYYFVYALSQVHRHAYGPALERLREIYREHEKSMLARGKKPYYTLAFLDDYKKKQLENALPQVPGTGAPATLDGAEQISKKTTESDGQDSATETEKNKYDLRWQLNKIISVKGVMLVNEADFKTTDLKIIARYLELFPVSLLRKNLKIEYTRDNLKEESGEYVRGENKILLNALNRLTLGHELGHAFKSSVQGRFRDISWKKTVALPLVLGYLTVSGLLIYLFPHSVAVYAALSFTLSVFGMYTIVNGLYKLKPGQNVFVTGYASQNPDEDFAETFMHYIMIGDKFREAAAIDGVLKQKYEFMKKYVFKGNEYTSDKDYNPVLLKKDVLGATQTTQKNKLSDGEIEGLFNGFKDKLDESVKDQVIVYLDEIALDAAGQRAVLDALLKTKKLSVSDTTLQAAERELSVIAGECKKASMEWSNKPLQAMQGAIAKWLLAKAKVSIAGEPSYIAEGGEVAVFGVNRNGEFVVTKMPTMFVAAKPIKRYSDAVNNFRKAEKLQKGLFLGFSVHDIKGMEITDRKTGEKTGVGIVIQKHFGEEFKDGKPVTTVAGLELHARDLLDTLEKLEDGTIFFNPADATEMNKAAVRSELVEGLMGWIERFMELNESLDANALYTIKDVQLSNFVYRDGIVTMHDLGQLIKLEGTEKATTVEKNKEFTNLGLNGLLNYETPKVSIENYIKSLKSEAGEELNAKKDKLSDRVKGLYSLREKKETVKPVGQKEEQGTVSASYDELLDGIGITGKEKDGISARYKSAKEMEERIAEINKAISAIEKDVTIAGYSMPASSRKAIMATYLENKALKCGPDTVVPRALRENPVRKDELEDWITAHRPELQGAARLIAENINYIDEYEFEKQLKETVDEFNADIGDKKYFVLLLTNANRRKSAEWVYALAKEKGLKMPAQEWYSFYEKDKPDYTAIIAALKAAGINDILILDDASFSGGQVRGQVNSLNSAAAQLPGLTVHVALPFITGSAKLHIMDADTKNIKVVFGKHAIMPTIDDIFAGRQEEALKYFGQKGKKSADISDYVKTLTYFQHKVPDEYSTFQRITQGTPISSRKGAVVEFINPTTPAPYGDQSYRKTVTASANSFGSRPFPLGQGNSAGIYSVNNEKQGSMSETRQMVTSIIETLKPLAVIKYINIAQERLNSLARQENALDPENGTIYHVVSEITDDVKSHAETGFGGANSIIVAPLSAKPARSEVVALEDRININGTAFGLSAGKEIAANGKIITTIYMDVPAGKTLGECAQALFGQINNKSISDALGLAASLEALVVVADKEAFKGMRSAGLKAGAAYVVEGNRDIKWNEAKEADRVIEDIYGKSRETMLGLYGLAKTQKNREGFMKAMELILAVPWELAATNPKALAAMVASVGAGNIRLTGIPAEAGEGMLKEIFGSIKAEGPQIRIMRDYKAAGTETLDQIKAKIMPMLLSKGAFDKGMKYDGIELDLSELTVTDAREISRWLNSISAESAESVVITALLPKYISSASVSEGLNSNVSVTEEFGKSDGGENKCVKVTIQKGFEVMDIVGKLGHGQGRMFEIAFAKDVAINGEMLEKLAEGLKGMLAETADMLYKLSRNYPSSPAKEAIVSARAALKKHNVNLASTDFEAALSGLSGQGLENLLAELEAFARENQEEGSPFFDKFIEVLNSRGTTEEARLDTARKLAGLIRGAGEAALVTDYLDSNKRKGFGATADRDAFGELLWSFEGVKDAVTAKGPEAYAEALKGNLAQLARDINIMIALGERAASDKMLEQFKEYAQDDAAKALYAGLLKESGRNVNDSALVSAALSGYTGDMKIIRQYNLTGDADGIGEALKKLNPKIPTLSASDVIEYAKAFTSFGEFSYRDTSNMLGASKLRLEELAASEKTPVSLAEIDRFKILDLMSNERMKFSNREKKSDVNMNTTLAFLGAA